MAEKVKNIWESRMGCKISALKTAYKAKGITGLTDSIAADLLAWRNTEIKIALTGESGAGKSTFINSLRGLNSDSEGGAATGGTETTTEITPYLHPSNKNFLLVDLPGVGTKSFPRKDYLKLINFELFDFFIIASEKRFSENDIWLAKEIEARERHFYFIRTKFDCDLKNEKRKRRLVRPLNSSEQDEMKSKIIDDLRRSMTQLKCKDNIFIIDSFERSKFDFPELEKRLKSNTIKKDAMILTLQAVTEEAINEKKTLLEDRIWLTALRAAIAPRANDADVAILKKEKEFYLWQFNLDAKSLKHDASLANITDDNLSELLENPNLEEETSQEKTYTDEFAKLLPFLPIANQIKTYRIGKKFLTSALDSIVKRAIEVSMKMASGIAGQCEN